MPNALTFISCLQRCYALQSIFLAHILLLSSLSLFYHTLMCYNLLYAHVCGKTIIMITLLPFLILSCDKLACSMHCSVLSFTPTSMSSQLDRTIHRCSQSLSKVVNCFCTNTTIEKFCGRRIVELFYFLCTFAQSPLFHFLQCNFIFGSDAAACLHNTTQQKPF